MPSPWTIAYRPQALPAYNAAPSPVDASWARLGVATPSLATGAAFARLGVAGWSAEEYLNTRAAMARLGVPDWDPYDYLSNAGAMARLDAGGSGNPYLYQ
jgi:hypothetical protein